MITRLRFADDPGWRDGIEAVLDAPGDARPLRVAVATAMPAGRDAMPCHLGVVEEWFVDEVHLRRSESWSAEAPGPGPSATGSIVVAEPVVLRGEDWLEGRWVDGGPRYKHMALAVRADGLTPAVFSARWRDHAGRATASGVITPIPDDVKGRAYVQHHPLPLDEHDWIYDAVNEVYFDDLDGLRGRIDWFGDNAIGQVPDELFGATRFLALREEVVEPSPT